MNQRFVDGSVDQSKVMEAFAAVLAPYMGGGQQVRKATGTPVGPYLHGPGGLFGVRGLSRDIISTHTQITGSLGELLPIRASDEMNPLFPFITGFLRSDQQEKNLVCDDPAQAANMKTCIQTVVFGRKEFKTRTAEINRIGQRINRGEFMDLQVLNGPLVNSMAGLMQDFFGLRGQQAALGGREMLERFIEVGVAYQRWFCPTVYTGHPANSSAGGGYKEFPGLDLLIGRNKVDALTGTACPSLYSTIIDFAFRQVDSNTDPNIVRTVASIHRMLTRKAEQQNLAPVEIAIVMRGDLFYELTRQWPCQYNTDGCGVGASKTQEVNMNDAVRFRDDMRNNNYLLIDGKKVTVIVDDCIPEDNKADQASLPIGGFASDIYFVPLTARGGTITTMFWQYFDYRAGTLPAVGDARANSFFWSDDGVFLWGIRPPNNWCIDIISKVEPRLILRTPQLAARLTNVAYTPFIHTDDPLPSQDYWVNGGVSTGRPLPSPYSEWNTSGPGMGA